MPPALAKWDQWVIWRYETRKGKTTKVPYRARDNRRASTTAARDWASVGDAIAAKDKFNADGIGFVFSKDDPYCGVDLDGCVTDGVIDPEAQKLIDSIGGYSEHSPSGTGVHVIAKATLNGGGHRTDDTPWGGNVEVYAEGRYFTFSGRPLNGRRSIGAGDLAQVIALIGKSSSKSAVGDWLEKARRNPKFAALYDDGDWSDYGSQSEADLALFNYLIEAIGPKPFELKRAFKRSGLYRPDKSGGEDYLDRTLDRAFKDRPRSSYDARVADRVEFLRVDVDARQILQAEQAKKDRVEFPDVGRTLVDDLAQPAREVRYRIDQLHPVGGNVVLIAGYKLGKTSITLDALRALADGVPFQGRFETAQVDGRIAVFNYELAPDMWTDWTRDLGLQNPDRIVPWHLRGMGTLRFWVPAVQDRLVEWMKANEVRYWILDPTARAWESLLESEGDNMRAGQFTNAIDDIKQRAGIEETLLTHHTGRDTSAQHRGRGPTRLEDWMDAGWYLTGVRNALRFGALGREVELEDTPTKFVEEKNRSFFIASPRESEEAKVEEVQRERQYKKLVIEALTEHPDGLSKNKLFEAVGPKCAAHGIKAMGKSRALVKFEEYANAQDNPVTFRLTGKNKTQLFFIKKDSGGSQP